MPRVPKETKDLMDRTIEKAVEGCKYCLIPTTDGRLCMEKSPNSELLCSRPEGHSGEHVACGMLQHPMEIWK